MTPTIRIDDEVFEALQSRARPFVDTPNSVLRELLELNEPLSQASAPTLRAAEIERPTDTPNVTQRKRVRASAGELLPQSEYFGPILQILYEEGGEASARDVIDRLPEKIGSMLKRRDYEPTRRGDVRWRNRAQWARNALVEEGLIAANSPRGIWQLSESGRKRVEESIS